MDCCMYNMQDYDTGDQASKIKTSKMMLDVKWVIIFKLENKKIKQN